MSRYGKKSTYEITPQFLEVLEYNKKTIMLFFKNNEYKVKKNNINLNQQIKQLKLDGFSTVDHSNVLKLKKGLQKSCSLSYLNIFCWYWKCNLIDMISFDMEEYDKKLSQDN